MSEYVWLPFPHRGDGFFLEVLGKSSNFVRALMTDNVDAYFHVYAYFAKPTHLFISTHVQVIFVSSPFGIPFRIDRGFTPQVGMHVVASSFCSRLYILAGSQQGMRE